MTDDDTFYGWDGWARDRHGRRIAQAEGDLFRPGTRVRNGRRGQRIGTVVDPGRDRMPGGFVLVAWRPGDSHVLEHVRDLIEVEETGCSSS